MKVEIKITAETKEPYAVIYSSEMTEEIRRTAAAIDASGNIITATENERIVVLQPEEIYMIRVENGKTTLYCLDKKYVSGKRLYDLEAQLSGGFMRISKSVLINLKKIQCVEPSLNGMMLLTLKNKCKDYISRKYLPEFKKYLGL